jgi:hypothetical protein
MNFETEISKKVISLAQTERRTILGATGIGLQRHAHRGSVGYHAADAL